MNTDGGRPGSVSIRAIRGSKSGIPKLLCKEVNGDGVEEGVSEDGR